MMDEIWKDIKGYEGLYKISNKGRVQSVDRYVIDKLNRSVFKPGQILEQTHNKSSNYYVSLCKDGKPTSINVAYLVAHQFLPNKDDYKYIIHIDGNGKNNNVENLKWVSTRRYGVQTNKIKDAKYKLIFNNKIVNNNMKKQNIDVSNIDNEKDKFKTYIDILNICFNNNCKFEQSITITNQIIQLIYK